MNPGVILGSLFPWVHWGSHWLVTKNALHIIREAGISKDEFVTLRHLMRHEGVNGLDGLWLRGKYPASAMHYNPINGQGTVHQEIERFTKLLAASYTSWPDRRNEVARFAAYLSHEVADAFCPHHQVGRFGRVKERWLFLRVDMDWIDELDDGTNTHVSHQLLEAKLMFYIFGHKLKKSSLDMTLLQNLRDEKFSIANYITQQVADIRKFGVYHEYLEKGWTKRVSSVYHDVVFPRAMSVVATLWYFALKGKE